ncbi:unnamed protein product [Soboliphyme baturini]|uniref:Nonstructural protein n=1 Tax=Soboliphyme baturini TaxID=241478 RepID=A0A183IBX3_9BILA|nr:unnamed protein product [Soboliphyme baturini]
MRIRKSEELCATELSHGSDVARPPQGYETALPFSSTNNPQPSYYDEMLDSFYREIVDDTKPVETSKRITLKRVRSNRNDLVYKI